VGCEEMNCMGFVSVELKIPTMVFSLPFFFPVYITIVLFTFIGTGKESHHGK